MEVREYVEIAPLGGFGDTVVHLCDECVAERRVDRDYWGYEYLLVGPTDHSCEDCSEEE